MEAEFKNTIDDIVATILEDYKDDKIINEDAVFTQPDADAVIDILQKLIKVVYPGFYHDKNYKFYNLSSRTTVLLEDVMYNLNKQIALALPQNPDNQCKCHDTLDCEASQICMEFFKKIPKIREYVDTDVQAFYDGDPAAYNYNEIILCYPGLLAITTNRIAHELHLLGVPLIPRMMTEYAHSKTGIDIHPGAQIGKYFFIDHGTGIVVGETTIIGEHVKVYQGVTIGALSTRGGQSLKGVKRHPTIEDNVIIYAGASILGGETVIGEGAVIGSNAFITSSIEAGARVSMKNQELNLK
ncbi:MAG: serine acetyltransferase [Agathobacter sp.]|nr:serine acetyltransferase [Agathobacter sp.]MEE1102211.1 serine acetyltransferase [Agathobacter sp.]